jgi:ABC-type transporter Mla subunit MlaD
VKRILLSAVILLAAGAFLVIAGGASNGSTAGSTYKIELDNAFGIVTGADFKVAGVRAGTIKSLDLCDTVQHSGCLNPLHALVTVQVTQTGFGAFHRDAFCQSRPQSLIGEYFIDCDPGHSGTVLKSGSTIPVTHTESTIPADLLNDVMRLPYRQRFSLIINELGAAVAGRSEDLQSALKRAVPALTQTDNLLNVLANDSRTLQQLTVNSDAVITALARNSTGVQQFIREANRSATATATQQSNLQATLQKLPGFLEQLRPTVAQLGAAADANTPALVHLDAASGNLNRLFKDLPAFASSSLPAFRALGKASVTGKEAVEAAGPTVHDLNQFAQPTPELAQNLAIVLRTLDNRSRAVEKTPGSPGGKGFTGLEALLQYVFDQGLAINTFGQFGHILAVDSFLDPQCSFYESADRVALSLKKYGASYRHCYAWLGPNQPGVNETDPTNPRACVPDPGGAPPGEPGPKTTACKLTAAAAAKHIAAAPAPAKPTHAADTAAGSSTTSGASSASTRAGPASASSSNDGSSNSAQPAVTHVASVVGGGGAGTSAPADGSSGGPVRALLNYLLAP